MAASPNTTPMPEKLRPTIEAEIERLIALLDAMDGDPVLEPSLGFSILALTYAGAVDLEGDTADDEPTRGAIEAKLPAPGGFFGGRMQGLFPATRVRSATAGSVIGWSERGLRARLRDARMTPAPERIDCVDRISIAKDLIQAVWMAAADLEQWQETAFQTVCKLAMDHLAEASRQIEEERGHG